MTEIKEVPREANVWDLSGPSAAAVSEQERLEESRLLHERLKGLALLEPLCEERELAKIRHVHNALRLHKETAWRSVFGTEDEPKPRSDEAEGEKIAAAEPSDSAAHEKGHEGIKPAPAEEDMEIDLYGDLGGAFGGDEVDLYGDLTLPESAGGRSESSTVDKKTLEARMKKVEEVYKSLVALERECGEQLIRDAHEKEFGKRTGDTTRIDDPEVDVAADAENALHERLQV